ncbi:MAG: 16S rRNA (guanine(527)-N(7))-methyltransferase RsmG [Methylococcales bacterium]|nr:16S rRNA (guanine(527)-N(7))-methyltransferase RsmG [Methylococcales bacterium]
MEACRTLLESGLKALNLPHTAEQIDQLLAFIKLIAKWNKAYNLTAVRNNEDMARLHILDSLAILPYIEGKRVIDIGTGAGLPGIPLAIFLPEVEFVLLDSNAKKTRFVQQVILELKLKNVSVIHSRAEDYQPELGFDSITTRAFSSLPDMVTVTAHLLNPNGVILAMKGQIPEAELAEIKTKATLIPINVPEVEAERCLVRINSQ